MQARGQITFPTLVLTIIVMTLVSQPVTVRAAKPTPSPDFIDSPAPQPTPTDQQKEFIESSSISPEGPASPVEVRRLGYFYKYRNGLSAMSGGVFDTKSYQDESKLLLVRSSLLFLFHDDALRSYEVGADLLSDNTGSISVARRFIFERTKFRPYTKLGAAVRLDPKDQLATFLRLQHYRLFGAAGFELLIADPISFRFEAGLGASMESFEASTTAGLTWGW